MSETLHAPDGAYQSVMKEWDERSSVRSKARPHLSPAPEGLPFPEDLVSIVKHPDVVARGENMKYQILGKRLHAYNRSTAELEGLAVVPACMSLGLRKVPFSLPREMAVGALKIATDEGHHAVCAETMTLDLTRETGVTEGRYRQSRFLHKLELSQQTSNAVRRAHSLIAGVFASETLISSILAKVPKDMSVIEGVRKMAADHALDEGKHHDYFSKLMPIMWDQLSSAERDFVGPQFAEWVTSFLEPDKRSEMDWLEDVGFSSVDADRIVREVYEEIDTVALVRLSARPTLIQLKRAGIFDHGATADSLGKHGLL